MDWGAHAEFLERARAETGMNIQALDDRVDPDLHLAFEWRAFQLLNTDRPASFGRAPIPWSAIHRFAEFEQLSIDEADRFVALITQMDAAFLKWAEEMDEAKRKNAR